MSKLTRFSELEPLPAESSWFRPYRIFPGVTAIYEPYHFQEVISYLIEGEDRALLLDSGMGFGSMKAMVEFLTDKPVTLVNSHSHFDHVGSNWQFPETHLLDVPDCIEKLETGLNFQADDANRQPEALWYKGKPWFDLATWTTRPSCPVKPIHDGDVFDLGGRRLRVIATPGHSRDSIMLSDDANKLLFTGDTVYPAPLYAYIESPAMVPVYARTMERLAGKYSGYTLICSHNNPVWEGSALTEIAGAFRTVLAGKGENCKKEGDQLIYPFGDFSIVLSVEACGELGLSL